MAGRSRASHPLGSLLVVGLLGIIATVRGTGVSSAESGRVWKGAETLSPVSLAPNAARCGPFPRHIEARMAGSGVDTNGGPYTVVASGCLDTQTDVIFDLEATDTYLRTGEAVRIDPENLSLDVDPGTCVAANREPVRFKLAGGSGRYVGAEGAGTYTLAMTMPDCVGPQVPAQLWFEGRITFEE
jgi:hypothetical protein